MNALFPTASTCYTPILPIQQQISIVLSEGSTLEWIGFSTPNSCLVSMDSSFKIRLLFRGGGNSGIWYPIFNGGEILSERAPDDSIWPVSVLERSVGGVGGQFRYVFCKGTRYPQATKTLVPLTVQWNIPVLAQVHFKYIGFGNIINILIKIFFYKIYLLNLKKKIWIY